MWERLYCHSVPLYHWSKNETIFRYDSSHLQAVQCDMPFYLAFLLLDKKAWEVARHVFCYCFDKNKSQLQGFCSTFKESKVHYVIYNIFAILQLETRTKAE